MHRRKFSKQFKIDAVELTLKEEKTVKEIADDLGIRVALLYRWRQNHLTARENAFPGTGHAKDAESERIRQLERQLRLVTEEREILKNSGKLWIRSIPCQCS
ncbi:transposase [Chlorobium sp.]|uniref:transposase n=1 Tax=Chlorobium sp. TaxID=1095 RepID=UPI003412D2D7